MVRGYIFHPPNETKARQWAAALQAAGIPCSMRHDQDGATTLLVFARHIDAATSELAWYETVNCDWPPAPAEHMDGAARRKRRVQTSMHNELLPVILCGLLLPLWHLILTVQERAEAFTRIGAADRTMIIVRGQWWRAITALTLHVDAAHVAGNSVWGILLGCVLAMQTGAGGALLLGLFSGFGGNLLAAAIVQEPRSAIGASTAVLGLVGLLTGLRFLQTLFEFTPRGAGSGIFSRRSWPALIAGLAALAILGSAQHTDLIGHLAGFLTGLALSPIALLVARHRRRTGWQLLMLTVFITLLAAGWLMGIVRG